MTLLLHVASSAGIRWLVGETAGIIAPSDKNVYTMCGILTTIVNRVVI